MGLIPRKFIEARLMSHSLKNIQNPQLGTRTMRGSTLYDLPTHSNPPSQVPGQTVSIESSLGSSFNHPPNKKQMFQLKCNLNPRRAPGHRAKEKGDYSVFNNTVGHGGGLIGSTSSRPRWTPWTRR